MVLETYDWSKEEEEQNKQRYLSSEDGYDDVCFSCDYLWKELKDKTQTCADCIFSMFKKQ